MDAMTTEREEPMDGVDGQPSFNDDELRLIVKSLSITHDALSNKLGRLKGRYHEEAVMEYRIVDTALTKARAAQSQRITR